MARSFRASLRRIGVGLWLGGVACAPGTGATPRVIPLASGSPTAAAPAPLLPYETLDQVRYRLLEEQDTDCDQAITIDDPSSRRFRFRLQGQAHDYQGARSLSNLLEELELARQGEAAPRLDRIGEDPVARMSRRIRTDYWPALTRRLDEDGLPDALEESSSRAASERFLYVPSDDARALAYFRRAAKRYGWAYAELARSTAGVDGLELGNSDLTAMLRSAEGRESLAELSRRLAAAARGIDYPGLSRFWLAAIARLGELFEQAGRPCVNTNGARIARVAQQVRGELGKFAAKTLSVREVPDRREWAAWLGTLGSAHGLLSLALEDTGDGPKGVPFVAPGAGTSGGYGWDSYFIVRGLIADDRLDLARGVIDNATYVIEHYGSTLGDNQTHSLTRSQPPFMASMIRALWQALPTEGRDRRWLARALHAAIREYDDVWNQPPRRSGVCRGDAEERVCLDRYAGVGRGQPVEVEAGHFDGLWQDFGRSLEASYRAGVLPARDLVSELDRAFEHDRCMREAGHDTTYRWFWNTSHGSGGVRPENRCADMLTVDLNSLLYKYEVDVAFLLGEVGASLQPPSARRAESTPSSLGLGANVWCARAQMRFGLIKTYLWSARDGLFYDALLEPNGAIQTGYVSATTLYPLWATADACGGAGPAFGVAEKSMLVTNALRQLEAPGGLLASAPASRERFSRRADRGWDYPAGWAPHQMLAWYGLEASGFRQDADRLIASWLFMLVSHAMDHAGSIGASYDVTARTPNGGSEGLAQGESSATEGVGWMNASFEVGLALLSPGERRRLNQSLAAR